MGGKGGRGKLKNICKGPVDKDNGMRIHWELGVGRAGETSGGENGTIIIEQQ